MLGTKLLFVGTSGQHAAGATLHICTWQVYSLNAIILFIGAGSHYVLAI